MNEQVYVPQMQAPGPSGGAVVGGFFVLSLSFAIIAGITYWLFGQEGMKIIYTVGGALLLLFVFVSGVLIGSRIAMGASRVMADAIARHDYVDAQGDALRRDQVNLQRDLVKASNNGQSMIPAGTPTTDRVSLDF